MVRRVAGLVLAALLLAAVALPPRARAAEGPAASLTVHGSYEGGSLEGLPLSVYRVGGLNAAGAPALSPEYARYGVSLDPVDAATWKSAAEMLAGYIQRDRAAADGDAVLGADGAARFTGLAEGIYLVRGDRLEGKGFYFDPEPFLVALPRATDKGPSYQVSVNLKGEGTPRSSEPVSIKVLKLWKGQADPDRLPKSIAVDLLRDGEVFDTVELTAAEGWRHIWTDLDAASTWQVVEHAVPEGYAVTVGREGNAFVLTNRFELTGASVQKVWRDGANAKSRPKSIEIQLLRDGRPHETVTLSEANGWRHAWDSLDAGHAWSVAEPAVPAGYVSEVTQDGGAFTVTNTFGTPPSLLPQTGDLWWPVPALAAAGALCYLIARLTRPRSAR